MEFDVLTLFPEIFPGPLDASILGRARAKGLLHVSVHQIREHARDKHRTTDDLPYGGGPGMVMKPEPLFSAWEAARARSARPARTVLLSPQGQPLCQASLERWAAADERLILVCGRYEGIDERFIEECVDEEVSLGDFVLTGGELAALALIDGVTRLIPGVLGNEASSSTESFSALTGGLLEGPQYTRPPEFRGRTVPDVLLSGDHKKIAAWRRERALERTQARRPDLLAPAPPARGGQTNDPPRLS